jgi:large subunit ribosomal protein L2
MYSLLVLVKESSSIKG